MFFIIVPPEMNPAPGTHLGHSIAAMVKHEVLMNGHKAVIFIAAQAATDLSTGAKSVLVIAPISTYVPPVFGRRLRAAC